MPTILKDKFSNNSEVCMDMCDDELFVFVWVKGEYKGVSKWPQDSYHLPLAMAHYQREVDLILQMMEK